VNSLVVGYNKLYTSSSVSDSSKFLDTPIDYLKGVGPVKGELLKNELSIFTFRDLLFEFPFRYIDRTKFHTISSIRSDGEIVQLRGTVIEKELKGDPRRKRLCAVFKDQSGFIDLVWFRSVKWIEKSIEEGSQYIVYGRIKKFKGQLSIAHPEMEKISALSGKQGRVFEPVYHSTEKLGARGLDSRGTSRKFLLASLVRRMWQNCYRITCVIN